MRKVFCSHRALWSLMAAATCCLIPSLSQAGQSLSQAIEAQLQPKGGTPCLELLGESDDPLVVFSGGLQDICNRFVPANSVSPSQSPSASNTSNLTNEASQLLKTARNSTETAELTSTWSLFANVESETLDHDATPLEGAYGSTATRMTLGMSYALSSAAQLGLALVSKNHQGDYQLGGDFDNSSLGFRFIADVALTDNSFLQLLAGTDSTDTKLNRYASYSEKNETNVLNVITVVAPRLINSDFSYNQTEAAAVLGMNWPIGNATLTPHLGLTWQNSDFGTYSEAGDSGLEVTIHDDQRTSLQGNLGLQAAWAINTRWGVWAPQLGANLINEFDDKARQVQVSFTGDTRGKRFTYDTEEADRNYVSLSAGSVFVLKQGVQLYINVEGYAAYDDYNRSLISSGFRWEI